jgi:hypothetical protein
MRWISDAWDAVSDWFGGSSSGGSSSNSGGNWLDRNWNSIGKLANAGSKIYGAIDANNSRQQSRNDIGNLLDTLAKQDDAYNQQLYQWQNRQAAGRAAAQRQNDRFRRKAANKAYKEQKRVMNQLIQTYQPYAQAAQQLTPKMAQNYGQFLDTTSLLNQYLTPKAMNVLSQPVAPAWSNQIPDAAYQAPRVEGAQVSFPSVDQILGIKK